VWCGFACPQTVFLEGVFRRIERWLEGPREARIRRNAGPMTADTLWRKTVKQAIYVALCLLLAHAFIAYFVPVGDLLRWMRASPGAHWTAFVWVAVMAGLLYFDFAWFREQVCLIVCPYGRFQSALIDDDTLVIGYDVHRGEPRSKASEEGGDCVDCRRCVVVCPTGIDIRNGLQMECIGCTNCVDACDSIMRQVGRPEGLVRYDSYRGFHSERKRFLRPRLFLYAGLALVGLSVFGLTASKRSSFEVTVLRARGMPYTIENERIQNLFTIHVQNKSPRPAQYRLAPAPALTGQPAIEWKISSEEVEIESLGESKIAIFAFVPRADYKQPIPATLLVTDEKSGEVQQVELKLQGP
jgi:cytochrome c oxidase accessory protein FixG